MMIAEKADMIRDDAAALSASNQTTPSGVGRTTAPSRCMVLRFGAGESTDCAGADVQFTLNRCDRERKGKYLNKLVLNRRHVMQS